jgi:hypothetical protein
MRYSGCRVTVKNIKDEGRFIPSTKRPSSQLSPPPQQPNAQITGAFARHHRYVVRTPQQFRLKFLPRVVKTSSSPATEVQNSVKSK